MSEDKLFFWVFSFLVFQRLSELVLAKRNEKLALLQGAVEYDPKGYLPIVVVHLLWFVSFLVEYSFPELFFPLLPIGDNPVALVDAFTSYRLEVGLAGFGLGQALRYTAIVTLGIRWNTKILVLPQVEPVQTGIYRWIKHPNYWGVRLELFFLPIAFGYFATAIVFSIANHIVLRRRISEEEKVVYATRVKR